jgi:pimeloyl-ACP methyl ester carboxylesterase
MQIAAAVILLIIFNTGDIEMTFINTKDDNQIYLKDWGHGSLVVLIHGWPLSADSWDDVALALANAGHRVIAYDRRGFGRSSQPWKGYDYDTLADDLAAVLNYAAADSAALVGFSMGGGEVARYMSRYAGKGINKAVLISSILPFRLQTEDNPLGTPLAKFDKTDSALRSDRAHFFSGFFKDFFGTNQNSQAVSNELLTWARGIALQAGTNSTIACFDSFCRTDFRSDLAAFKVPTLFIHGTEDLTVPIESSSRLAAAAIPHATLLEYVGAPHGLFATHKDRLAHDLLDFLKH